VIIGPNVPSNRLEAATGYVQENEPKIPFVQDWHGGCFYSLVYRSPGFANAFGKNVYDQGRASDQLPDASVLEYQIAASARQAHGLAS
jgi:hypothetical protein